MSNKEVHGITKEEFIELFNESKETYAKNSVDRAVAEIKEIVYSDKEVQRKVDAAWEWLGVIRIVNLEIPVTYTIIGVMSIIGATLGVYNLIN